MLGLVNIKNRSKFCDQQDENILHMDRNTAAAPLDAKNFHDECVTSSVESLLPQASRILRGMSSSLWSRPWCLCNQSTTPARLKTHSNELSILYPPRMHSKPIPSWQVSPAAYVGYRYRLRR
ncbi:uncharacterized protein LOC6527880 [Drosophila yakuba]|uniref:Uncharacterized protein n=1 Tax=Drosophila yakuba TaxID=7245 RepID=B4NY62_DROYA|nr:uncharacterized protein LOC6527880 [Drosophila yakuba]EDW88664.1 uncharacterized protein Dyak_GE10435 [Drosophila yakuba]